MDLRQITPAPSRKNCIYAILRDVKIFSYITGLIAIFSTKSYFTYIPFRKFMVSSVLVIYSLAAPFQVGRGVIRAIAILVINVRLLVRGKAVKRHGDQPVHSHWRYLPIFAKANQWVSSTFWGWLKNLNDLYAANRAYPVTGIARYFPPFFYHKKNLAGRMNIFNRFSQPPAEYLSGFPRQFGLCK